MQMQILNFRLTEEDKAKLKELAKSVNRGQGEYLREVIRAQHAALVRARNAPKPEFKEAGYHAE